VQDYIEQFFEKKPELAPQEDNFGGDTEEEKS